MEQHIQENTTEFSHLMDQVCGFIDVPLEGRFEFNRHEETNVCNFVADMMLTRFHPNCDLAILTAGTIRSNTVYPQGDLTNRSVNEILPFPD